MGQCLGGTIRRAGAPLPRDPRSNTVKRSPTAARARAIGRQRATKSRATTMKEPGD
jgi:hypothetical protein